MIAECIREERLAFRFIPFEVRAQTPMPCDRVERLSMAFRMLAEIQPDEGQSERGGAAQDVGLTSVRNDGLCGLDQRPITELQGFDELRR